MIANELIKKETIERKDFERLMKKSGLNVPCSIDKIAENISRHSAFFEVAVLVAVL